MPIPMRQSARIGWYLFNQKLHKREKFPLIVELEPLFACNLACPGCGKIQHPHDVLRQRMPVEQAVAAIKECQKRGFRVTTNTTFFSTDTPQTVIDVLDYLNDDLAVDQMMISPAYAYEKAPDQEHFLGVTETRELFRKAFANGNRRRWRLNHSPLFLDFLEGKTDFACTAWGIPSYSLLGWQRPCYLMSDGYTKTYKELIETTNWDSYGRGKDPRCANCMAHCGYEPSAVLATMGSLRASLRAIREN